MIIYPGIVLSFAKNFRKVKEKRMEREKESGKEVKVSDFQLFVTAPVLVEQLPVEYTARYFSSPVPGHYSFSEKVKR